MLLKRSFARRPNPNQNFDPSVPTTRVNRVVTDVGAKNGPENTLRATLIATCGYAFARSCSFDGFVTCIVSQ